MRFPAPLFSIVLSLASVAACLTSVRAQDDVLHYDFRSASPTNYARGPKAGPAKGALVSTNAKPWQGGKRDRALAGTDTWDYKKNIGSHNYVDTGWKSALTGSFTVGWYLRQRLAPPRIGALYLWGGDRGFRAFIGGRAGSGVSVAGWGGREYLDLNKTSVQGIAFSRWVHVALVVDAKAKLASWYVDGKFVQSQPLFDAPRLAQRAQGFRIGGYVRTDRPSFWNLDEFRLTARALTEVEIRGWLRAGAEYGVGCNATLRPTGGGKPIIGTSNYTLELRGPAKAAAMLGIGFSPNFLAGVIPLPIDLGVLTPKLKGCKWQTSMDAIVIGVTSAQGRVSFPWPLPKDPSLIGLVFYNQALVLGKASAASSNGWLFAVLGT